ncbi:MAG: hypothetical protein ACRD1S_00020 [Vicinamibacterales bacterium]
MRRFVLAISSLLALTVTELSGQVWTHEISDGNIWVRVDANRGGAITDFRIRENEVVRRNIVDNGDWTGRQFQVSFYQGNWGPDCFPCNASCYWGYNPVQAGNACQWFSGGAVLEHSSTRLVTETWPLQWNNQYSPSTSSILLRQTIEIVQPYVARVEYRVTNFESFAWDGTLHELPVAYVFTDFNQAYAYQGPSPFTYGPVTNIPIPSHQFSTTEPWIAISDVAGFTVALYVPGKYTDWTVSSVGNANLMQAWTSMPLNQGQQATAVVFFVGGYGLNAVRSRIYSLEGH